MRKRYSLFILIMVLCLSLAACGKNKEDETKAAEETSEEATLPEGISYPGAIRVSVPLGGAADVFGVMHATILDVQSDDNGNPVLTVRDDEDPENAWTVDTAFVKDVSITPEKGMRAALFFSGDIENDPDSVEMAAVWPDGKYTLKVVDGMTKNNTVDDFEVWEEGRAGTGKYRFVKNNCLADKETIGNSESVSVRVVYVDGGTELKYPLRIYRNPESE